MDEALRFLRDSGATEAEIEAARRDGYLPLLVLDRWVLPGARPHTRADASRLTGVPIEVAERLWRAMGFPDVEPDVAAFGDADVAALAFVAQLLERDADLDLYLQQTRVVATSMARIAEVWTDQLARRFDQAAVDADQVAEDERAAAEAADGPTSTPRRGTGLEADGVLEQVSEFRLDELALVFDYVHRRQLQNAIWRRFAHGGLEGAETRFMAVGFADLVGYTALSQQLTAEELSELVGRFDAVTHDAVAAAGGRVIKRIGDAVMFAIDDPAQAVDLALGLIDQLEPQQMVVRIGLAAGPTVTREGDAFGTVVNLASRLQSMARPNTVLIDEAVADANADGPHRIRSIGRRRIKDIGMHKISVVRRADG